MATIDEREAARPGASESDRAASDGGRDGGPLPGGSALVRTQALRLDALPLLALLLAGSIVLAAGVGAAAVPPGTTLAVLLNATHLFHFHRTWPLSDEVILLQLRLPRVVGAAIVGAGLAVAGALFQGLLRNPLADPFLLGTSAGAALGATVAFVVPALFVGSWLGFSLVAVCAFVGALLSATLVFAIATRGRQTPVVTLLLAGVAVSAILTAAQTLLLALHERAGFQLLGFYYWLAGSIDVQTWAQIGVLLPLTLAGVVAAVLAAPALDAFALGEEMAAHLGLPVQRVKLLIAALAALLVAAAVSISGLVGFVGLVAPHVCRITLGPRHRLLIPASALVGAIFVVLADLAARTLAAPSELPLGVITALAGGPFFLYLLRAAGRGYRW